MQFPESIQRAVAAFTRLPSLGPRQALRLVFYLISNRPEDVRGFTDALTALANVKRCGQCYFIFEGPNHLCGICGNQTRNHKVVMIVEKETDLVTLENTGKFMGRYLVLGNIARTGILEGWQQQRLNNLKSFIQNDLGGQAQEVILAFNHTALGDFQAKLLQKELNGMTPIVTRLGRGIPTGGEIEFADDETLSGALETRR